MSDIIYVQYYEMKTILTQNIEKVKFSKILFRVVIKWNRKL